MKRISFIFIISITIMIITGCTPSSSEEGKANTELTIYTSIYPIQYITEEITGSVASVSTVYPPGVDAHSYEPTSKKITDMAHSDAFIYLGAGMEGFSTSVADALQSHDIAFVEIGKDTSLFNHSHGDLDPHIWLDPLRMIKIARIITDELISLAPHHQEQLDDNFHQLEANLTALDQDFQKVLQEKVDKNILVSHAAYGYWEERFGIKQIAISGLSSGSEPSQKELTKIVDFAKKENLKYIIYEQNSSDRVSMIIQEHIGADALYIHNLEVLTEDDIKQGEDYLSLMQKNLTTLDQATK